MSVTLVDSKPSNFTIANNVTKYNVKIQNILFTIATKLHNISRDKNILKCVRSAQRKLYRLRKS